MLDDFHREAIASAIEVHGTPLYFYDLYALRKRCAEIRLAFGEANFELLFATMANPEHRILAALASANVGACVNSVEHLNAALLAGMLPSRIQFSSTSLGVVDLALIWKAGVQINLDSPRQVLAWLDVTNSKKIGVRLNAAALMGRTDGDRIGMDVQTLFDLQRQLSAREVSIVGVHVYVGTNFPTPEAMVPTIYALSRVARQLDRLEYINIGGGIGVDYSGLGTTFDLQRYGKLVRREFEDLMVEGNQNVKLFFEPGRGLLASSGIFVATITDIKGLNGITYVGTDASIAVFPRPFHHPESPHAVTMLRSGVGQPGPPVTVVGKTTFSRDILAKCSLPTDVGVGDVLLFMHSGAYCASMRSKFLGQKDPAIAFVGDE